MIRYFAAMVTLLGTLAIPASASAHCDTMQGPVVTAARAALDAGDASLVLHWVRPEDEATIRAAFQNTLEVRALGPKAKAFADRYFFETLVRIHRAGEGAPYTGLTDAEPEPIILATDRALEHGSAGELEQHLVEAVRAGLSKRFAAARQASSFRPGDVAGGRVYVAAYVPLTHWVEGVYTAAAGAGDHHAAAMGHEEAPHAVPAHDPDRPAVTAATIETPGRGRLQYLPWILTGFLAIAVLIEGAFLVRHRRHAAA